jgi:hypothetical protein
MKFAPRVPRFRTALWLVLAGWMVFSTAWLTRRWMAVRILDAAGERLEVNCHWELPRWAKPPDPRWKLLPCARVISIDVSSSLQDGRELAWAVQRCGPLSGMGVSFDTDRVEDGREVRAFLRELGRQKQAVAIEMKNVPLENSELTDLLKRLPNLEILTLTNMPVSGAGFPPLAALRIVSISNSPISDEGLAALLRCPSLNTLNLVNTEVTLAGIRQLPHWRQKELAAFEFSNGAIAPKTQREMRAALQQSCPDLRWMINGRQWPE